MRNHHFSHFFFAVIFTLALPSTSFASLSDQQPYTAELNQWNVRAQLDGQISRYHSKNYDDSKWDSETQSKTLEKGDIRWFRSSFDSAELPDPTTLSAAIVLAFRGTTLSWL